MSEQEQVDAILDGLPEEYGPFIMMIYSKDTTPSVADIESLLLMQEAQIEKFKTELGSASISVNVAHGGPNSSGSTGSNNSSNYSSNKGENESEDNRGRGSYRGRGGRNNNGNGRGRGRYGSGPKPTCQICFKYGHDAFNCWSRFDQQFVQPSPPPPNPNQQAHPYGYSNYPAPQSNAVFQTAQSSQNVVVYPNYHQGGSGFPNFQGPRPSQFVPQHPRAYVATQSTPVQGHTQEVQVHQGLDSQVWYPDYGASHHITSNQGNFSQHTPYNGVEQVHMGNGQGVHISSIGNTHFPSPLHPHITLSLHNLLHVPTITKNLMSVSQFARDNRVFFEFHSDHCLVKCQDSNAVLLRGSLGKDGLYSFRQIQMPAKSSSALTCLVAEKSCSSADNFTLWHRRLGHANVKAIKQVLELCNVSCSNKVLDEFCTACCLGKAHRIYAKPSETVYSKPFELV